MEFDHIAIKSNNISESLLWYVKNLGCEIIYEDETWGMLDCKGTKIAVVLNNHHPSHLAFKVESSLSFPCDQSEIKLHRDNSSYYYGSDPYGNIVEWIAYPDDSE